MTDPDVPPKRIFSYAEAAALLPEVRRVTEEAHHRVETLGEAAAGGSAPPDAQARIDEIVTEWAQAIIEKGVEVKGPWLVDFDNGSGYYCWRYPETGLHFFHSYEDGFRGRMPIQ